MSKFTNKTTKIAGILTITSIASVAIFDNEAKAATLQVVQAATGRPFLTFEEAEWTDHYDVNLQNGNTNPVRNWGIDDGRSVRLQNSGGKQTWVTPVNVEATGVTLSAKAFAYRGNHVSYFRTRICSFNSHGEFAYCSSFSDHGVSYNGSGTVSVPLPTDGTAFAQTEFQLSSPDGDATLFHVKFWS